MPKADFSSLPRTVWWEDPNSNGLASVCLIDQTRLPLQGDVLACHTLEGVELAIKSLALRGAPALGVGAALALALWSVNEATETTTTDFLKGLDKAAQKIAAARPTAVNLSWGARHIVEVAQAAAAQLELAALKNLIVATAQQMASDDERCNRAIGANGAPLLDPGSRVLTVCNAGSLATVYFGTALGVVYTAFDQGKVEHVWVTETRP
ncbi:MAG: hypothetical protein LBU48_06865, partial [Coriobacteriales bacterium]|nr:hypothetical protein [Coriobacteriales bacterium]